MCNTNEEKIALYHRIDEIRASPGTRFFVTHMLNELENMDPWKAVDDVTLVAHVMEGRLLEILRDLEAERDLRRSEP
jgi:hypothetical protein